MFYTFIFQGISEDKFRPNSHTFSLVSVDFCHTLKTYISLLEFQIFFKFSSSSYMFNTSDTTPYIGMLCSCTRQKRQSFCSVHKSNIECHDKQFFLCWTKWWLYYGTHKHDACIAPCIDSAVSCWTAIFSLWFHK